MNGSFSQFKATRGRWGERPRLITGRDYFCYQTDRPISGGLISGGLISGILRYAKDETKESANVRIVLITFVLAAISTTATCKLQMYTTFEWPA